MSDHVYVYEYKYRNPGGEYVVSAEFATFKRIREHHGCLMVVATKKYVPSSEVVNGIYKGDGIAAR